MSNPTDKPRGESTPAIHYRPAQHGVDCKKADHLGGGYLHDAGDDSPYEVDGLAYCGRCHTWLGQVLRKATP